ncbi:MerR family transcriptional regulator [Tepidamorphus sp. 3E244]|uniref:MerR family transcriptional regulator n=1 Tax=Tepidamorphus sp. 3E244 TaxID=3385498 RepID=UPI0038FCD3BD
MADKGPDAFRTISEVADDLEVPQHVLRFWETRFSQIKPMKRGGGRRYYRPDDVDLLRGIRKLLYGDGFTIKGVQRILKDRGVRHVIDIGAGRMPGGEMAAAPEPAAPVLVQPTPQPAAPAPAPIATPAPPAPATAAPAPAAQSAPAPTPAPAPPAAPEPTPAPATAPASTTKPASGDETELPPLPRLDSLRIFAHDRVAASQPQEPAPAKAPAAPPAPQPAPAPTAEKPPAAAPAQPAAEGKAEPPIAVPAVGRIGESLSADDIRRLQSVLFELGECRNLLTEALKR